MFRFQAYKEQKVQNKAKKIILNYFGGKQITRDEAVDFFKKAYAKVLLKKERLR